MPGGIAPQHQPAVDITSTVVNESAPSRAVGETWTDPTTDYVYQYVRLYASAASAGAAGQPLTWQAASTFVVDNSAAQANANQFAGICLGTVTKGYYTWILKRGRYSAIKTNGDDDIAEGTHLLIVSDATTGVCDSITTLTGSYIPFGVALAADSDTDNTVDGLVGLFG